MGVASNHHAVAALRIEVEGFDIVEHVKGLAEKLQISSIGKLGCTAGFIDITADGNDRRDHLERVQNVAPPDIAGMQDDLRALQGFQGFWTHFAMGICNHADLHACPPDA